jgi:hypothetical protein
MAPEGDRTRFVVDHEAIPAEWRDHIDSGYPTFYAEPMARHFATRRAASSGTASEAIHQPL